eukprot:2968491-Rhodomonas_salina.1
MPRMRIRLPGLAARTTIDDLDDVTPLPVIPVVLIEDVITVSIEADDFTDLGTLRKPPAYAQSR